MSNKPEMITPTGLQQERNLTPALIRDFLGAPDRTAVNPYYRSGPQMKLYLLDRVTAAEQTPEFRASLERAMKRKISAKGAAQVRHAKTLQDAAAIVVRVQQLPIAEVRAAAIRSYNDHNMFRNKRAYADDDPAFLDRITVNFIRHELSYYDNHLFEQRRKIGAREAAALIKETTLSTIADVYPELFDEAMRQHRLAGIIP